jgi:hypothetical protein
MDMKRPLMPGFLKKAEQKLLLNRPGIWSARTHLVLYYGVLFMLVLAGICFLDPLDVREQSQTPYWIGYVTIISVIALTVWLIYLLRFNVFKKYGIIHPLHMLVSFILYFIAAAVLVLFTYVQPAVESFKANRAIGDEEIVKDVNNMNLKLCQFEYNMLQLKWEYDTVVLVKDSASIDRPMTYEEYEVATDSVALRTVSRYRYQKMHISDFQDKRSGNDSLIKLNDTMYVMYSTPTFKVFDAYRADEFSEEKMLTSFQIYDRVLRRPDPSVDKSALVKELTALLRKYDNPEFTDPYGHDLVIEKEDTWFEIIRKKYRTYTINQNISNITEKKFRWRERHLPPFIRALYYFAIGITLLVFIFRHSTTRTFFLSLLSGILLTIFTALFLSFSSHNESGYFMVMIVYTILFLIGALTVWLNKKRNVVTGIFMNLFVSLIPFFPLICIAWYYRWKQEQYYAKEEYYFWENEGLYFLYAEIAGPVLFVILLTTLINKLYRRWYSLPQE